MHRFFCPDLDLKKAVVSLTDPHEIHHMTRVLRLKRGAGLILFDGKGNEGEGAIMGLTRQSVEVQIISRRKMPDTSRGPRIVLACAIPQKAKFELVIEKTTELGVDEIIPLITQRTQTRFTPDQARRKGERYRQVAVNAAKQSGRLKIPEIRPIHTFKDFITRIHENALPLIPCLTGQRKDIQEVLRLHDPFTEILWLIGPEGDFTPGEVALAVDKGCVPVSLGPTVLKVDTAAISVVATTHFLLRSRLS